MSRLVWLFSVSCHHFWQHPCTSWLSPSHICPIRIQLLGNEPSLTSSGSQQKVFCFKLPWVLRHWRSNWNASTLFYIYSILGAMTLVFVINSLVFLIPPEFGEKISFLISLFITNAVFFSYINRVTPRWFEDNIPYIVLALLVMCVSTVAVFIATIFTLHWFHVEKRQGSKGNNPTQPEQPRDNCTTLNTTLFYTCEQPKTQTGQIEADDPKIHHKSCWPCVNWTIFLAKSFQHKCLRFWRGHSLKEQEIRQPKDVPGMQKEVDDFSKESRSSLFWSSAW